MFVLAITNPETFGNVPEFDELMARAFPVGNLVDPRGYDADNFRTLLDGSNNILLVGGEEAGAEEAKLACVTIISLPVQGSQHPPQVLHFYNEGSTKLKQLMLGKLVEITRASGHIKFWAINGTDKPDSVWSRGFKAAGPSKRIGSIMEFDVA